MSILKIDASANLKEKIFQSFRLDAPADLEARLYNLDQHAHELADSFAPATPDECDAMEEYENNFMTRFTYHSTAMEGSTLSQLDTALVLEGEFVPSDDKEMRDYFAARGVAEGYDWAVRKSAENGFSVTEEFVKDVHERTALDCQPRTRGTYRRVAVYIRGSGTTPPDPLKVREAMADLMYAYRESTMHPFMKAAAFHAMLENIHPFRDGNGRTGRTVLNAMLACDGYPPVAFENGAKRAYAQALEDWQVRGFAQPFIEQLIERTAAEISARKQCIAQTREYAAALAEERVPAERPPAKAKPKPSPAVDEKRARETAARLSGGQESPVQVKSKKQ